VSVTLTKIAAGKYEYPPLDLSIVRVRVGHGIVGAEGGWDEWEVSDGENNWEVTGRTLDDVRMMIASIERTVAAR
jgi:hypothetical protein